MKLKAFITMALLSVSALGSCQTGGNPNVTELTKEQKDNLKYLYKWYQFFTETKPGIPEGDEAKERTEPLPWKETGGEFDPAPLKEWMTHARLGEDESYVASGRLALDGVYDPDENWNQADEIPDNISSDNPYEQKIASIKMFGNMRFNLLSRLRNTEGDTLKLLGSAMLYMSPIEKKFSLSFRTNNPRSADIEGSIEAELLPPLRWKYVRIPLLPEGKEYEFDGVKFKLFKSAPGDVILEYDKKYNEQIGKLEIIPIKGEKPMSCRGGYTTGGKGLLQWYRNPHMGFGEWCVTYMEENCDSLGTTPQALELAAHPHYRPTEEELRHFHETAGEIVGLRLEDLLKNANSKNYKELYREWVKKGYEAAVECKDDYSGAMGGFHDRYGDDVVSYIAFQIGEGIGSQYVKADLKPDWETIDCCATALMDRYTDAAADSLSNELDKHVEEYIDSLVERREVLTFLTDEDIRQLSKPVEPDDSPLMYRWYKTYTEADALYIYLPDTAADRPLLKVRYPMGGGKPEVLFSR